jgi:hypothetical protein
MSGVRLARHYLRWMLKKNWGPYPFHFERVGGADPGGDGALRDDENRTDCCGARDCGVGGGKTNVTVNSILAGPTESEGVGGFVQAMAKQQNKSKAEVERECFEQARPSSLLKRFATVG